MIVFFVVFLIVYLDSRVFWSVDLAGPGDGHLSWETTKQGGRGCQEISGGASTVP